MIREFVTPDQTIPTMRFRKKQTVDFLSTTPTPTSTQLIAKVTGPRGNSLHNAILPDDTEIVVTLPPKFRNLIWVKRGNYIIVEPLVQDGPSDKDSSGEVVTGVKNLGISESKSKAKDEEDGEEESFSSQVVQNGGTVNSKVFGTIEHVLFPSHIKELTKSGVFPAEFTTTKESSFDHQILDGLSDDDLGDGTSEEYEDDLVFENPNRRVTFDSGSESESSEEE